MLALFFTVAAAVAPAAAAPATSAVEPDGAPVVIAVTGVPSAQGHVHIDICTRKTFTTSDCVWSARAPAVAGTTMVTVPGVPPGRYAAQAFHDRDDSGKLNRNFLGIPTERVGFSNDAPVRFAPPKFDDAAFDHGKAAQHITFKLRSLP
jgi:uncharacterized protein (DUF2141 family)